MFTMFILMMSVALLFGAAILIDSKYFLPKRTKAYLKKMKTYNQAIKR